MAARKKKASKEPMCSQANPETSYVARCDVKTARPTEYKGIVYRSKSEAMFARYLELSSYDWIASREGGFPATVGFHYEPEYLDVNGWRPDFLVFYTSLPCEISRNARARIGKKYSAPETICHIVEYKPSRPTKTYVSEFIARCNCIFSNAYSDMLAYGAYAAIYYGSIFEPERGVIAIIDDEGEDEGFDWLAKYEDQVKATRFDLLRHSQ